MGDHLRSGTQLGPDAAGDSWLSDFFPIGSTHEPSTHEPVLRLLVVGPHGLVETRRTRTLDRMASRNRKAILVVVLGLVGLGTSVWYGPKLVREAYATHGWEATEAEIVSTEVDSETRRRSGGRRETDWVVRLRYRYQVDGETYTASRYRVAGELGADTRDQAERLARIYRVGDRISVWVDPDDPLSAVVVPGGEAKAWANVGFGVLLVGVAVWLYFKRVRGGGGVAAEKERQVEQGSGT